MEARRHNEYRHKPSAQNWIQYKTSSGCDDFRSLISICHNFSLSDLDSVMLVLLPACQLPLLPAGTSRNHQSLEEFRAVRARRYNNDISNTPANLTRGAMAIKGVLPEDIHEIGAKGSIVNGACRFSRLVPK